MKSPTDLNNTSAISTTGGKNTENNSFVSPLLNRKNQIKLDCEKIF